MAAKLLEGKPVAAAVLARVAERLAAATARGLRPPGLAVVRVGDDPASEVYVRNKERSCLDVGMRSLGTHLEASATTEQVRDTIVRLNEDPAVDGILLQLPLPAGLDETALLSAIDPAKDVDGFHPVNAGKLLLGRPGFVACTPLGVLELLDHHGVALAGAHAVVVGRSNIVGKPMALLLLSRHATVTVCHSRTRDLAQVTRTADVLVVAMGRPGSIRAAGVRPGAVVVDVGIGRVTDAQVVERAVRDPVRLRRFRDKGSLLLGDVCFDEVRDVAGSVTPVPGGVGPLTVAMLISNTWDGYAARQELAR